MKVGFDIKEGLNEGQAVNGLQHSLRIFVIYEARVLAHNVLKGTLLLSDDDNEKDEIDDVNSVDVIDVIDKAILFMDLDGNEVKTLV